MTAPRLTLVVRIAIAAVDYKRMTGA